MLKRAFSKLKLEHVVIGKGQFQLEKAKPNAKDTLEVCFLVQCICWCASSLQGLLNLTNGFCVE